MESTINNNNIDNEIINNKLNKVEKKIDDLIILINKLHIEKEILFDNDISECILLYSIKNDPFVAKLNLKKNMFVIRCLKCNINYKDVFLRRKEHDIKNITIYKEYEVSNSRSISSNMINKLRLNNKFDIKFYYGNFVIDKKYINGFINQYDKIISEYKIDVKQMQYIKQE